MFICIMNKLHTLMFCECVLKKVWPTLHNTAFFSKPECEFIHPFHNSSERLTNTRVNNPINHTDLEFTITVIK